MKFKGNGVLARVRRSGEWSLTDPAEAAEFRRGAAERESKYRQSRCDVKVASHKKTEPVKRPEPDVATAS